MLMLLNVVYRVNLKVLGFDLLIYIFFYKFVLNSYYFRE